MGTNPGAAEGRTRGPDQPREVHSADPATEPEPALLLLAGIVDDEISSAPHANMRTPIRRRLAAAPALFALPLLTGAAAAAPQESNDPAPAEEAAEEPAPEPLPARPPVDVEGTLPEEWASAHTWRSIGPANMGGRCTDIAVNPLDPNEYWVATATGGIVHTVNGGITYEHQFQNQRVSSVGAIAVAPSDPSVIWAGTGEANPRNSCSWGDGVYVSRDGGATWGHAGLERTFQISTIVVHPEDPDTAYVGALGRLWGPNDERGLYKTTDGGRSWERLHFVDEDTGVIEVEMHPTDPDTIVFATYERRRDMFDTNDPAVKWGEGSALWRTTDGGATIEKVTEGLPSVTLGRIGVSWSGSNPDNVFAVVETEWITQEPENAAWFGISFESSEVGARVGSVTEDSPGAKAGLQEDDLVLRIADTAIIDQAKLRRVLRDYFAGDVAPLEVVRDGELVNLEITFDRRPQEEEERLDVHGRRRDGPFGIGLGGQRSNAQDEQGPEGHQYGGIFKSTDRGATWTRINSLNPRPMYYSEIRVDPSDESYIYVLGTRLHRSSDGGATFTNDGHDGSVHVDHHALWVDPADGRHIILGNDGGIYVTRDRMSHWDHHNKLALGQFYNVTVGPRAFYNVYGGLQDNGSWGGPSRTTGGGATNEAWFRVGGGDGFRCIVDPTNPELVYYESQNGGMGRRDFGTGEGGYLRPRSGRGEKSYRFNWNTPFTLSAFNSSIYYSAGNHVFRSVEKGSRQRPISPEITATDRGAAVALVESPLDQDVLYVGTDDGALWMTEDGGDEWIDLMALNGTPAFEAGDEEAGSDDEAAPESAQRVAFVVPSTDVTLAGEWRCKAEGEGIESDDDGVFTITIAVDEAGKVTGSLASDIGDGPLKRVRWKESTGDLDFRFEGESLTLDFTSRVVLADGTISGRIEAAGGAFRFDWAGAKTGAAAEAEEAVEEAVAEEAADEGPEAAPEKPAAKKKKKLLKDTIDQFLPGRRYVSDLKASRFSKKRVYATFDGHRSDDTMPHVFVSEDLGQTWTSLRNNLPDEAGSVRAILEDARNENVLYLGTEHGIYASIDRGASWTRFNSNLPTVPVHDLAQHDLMGELVAGTHGRSVWICDVSAMSQMSEDAMDADATLFRPTDVHLRARGKSRGRAGNHGFAATNPYEGATISYALTRRAREMALEVLDGTGAVIATLEGSTDKGLHQVQWNLRASGNRDAQGRRRRTRRVGPGLYTVRMTVGGEVQTRTFEVHNDPEQQTTEWIAFEDAEEELQAIFDAHAEEADGM